MRATVGILAVTLGLLLLVNGAWMLSMPDDWFAANRIVWRTGPVNDHFIRDVGWTYAFCGTLCLRGAVQTAGRSYALGTAAIWLGGHAVIHLGEVTSGVCSASDFWRESPFVWGPPLIIAVALVMHYRLMRREWAA